MNSTVEQKIRDFRDEVTSLSHSEDRRKALWMFMQLGDAGERAHHDEILETALDAGFEEHEARDMAQMPDDIRVIRDLLAGRS